MKTANQPSSQARQRVVRPRQDHPGDHGDQTSVNSRDASQRDPDDVIRVGATEYHLPDGGVRPYVHQGEPHRPDTADKAPAAEGIGKRHSSPWLSESDNQEARRPNSGPAPKRTGRRNG